MFCRAQERAEWKSASTMPGEQYVTLYLVTQMHRWLVMSLVDFTERVKLTDFLFNIRHSTNFFILDSLLLLQEQHLCSLVLVMLQAPSFWISLTAKGQRILCWNVMHLHLVASPSVTTPRMLELGVEVGYMVVGLKFSILYVSPHYVHCTYFRLFSILVTFSTNCRY